VKATLGSSEVPGDEKFGASVVFCTTLINFDDNLQGLRSKNIILPHLEHERA
jgi:hypothetical protein